jgi:two-component system, OmpR family, phosphate regulon sensor histidine kinase PhoR
MSPRLNLTLRTFVCFFLIWIPFQSLDQWFYDRFFRVRGTLFNTSPIVLVQVEPYRGAENAIDPNITDPHLPEDKNHHVWDDSYFRKLVTKIRADSPRMIVIASYYDLVRFVPGKEWEKNDLVFSAVLNEEGRLLPPPFRLTPTDNYGFCNVFPDPDNTVRRAYLSYAAGESLALHISNRLNLRPPQLGDDASLYIDFRGPRDSYPSHSAKELLKQSQIQPGTFTDKIVLIGRQGTSVSGNFETPFGPMSRLEIQANTIDTILDSRFIQWLPRWVSRAVAAATIVLSLYVLLKMTFTVSWLLLVAIAATILATSLVLFSEAKMWLGVANPLFCIFGTHVLILGYTLRRQEEQQWHLRQQTQYLQEVDQFKNNFLSLFSHDLKTPIAKIRAIIHRLLAEQPQLPPVVQEDLKSVDRTNDELARLISDILKVTKMESMHLDPDKEVLDLNRLVEKAVQSLRFFADEQRVKLVMDLEPLFSIEGDPQLIQEVITNLVENAIKYAPPETEIIIRTLEENERVWVHVKDSGPGIPEDELPRVTGKFYRGKAATAKTKGTGLGLYLSKYFVELHGGQMQIKSTVGHGTEVSFWLPISA